MKSDLSYGLRKRLTASKSPPATKSEKAEVIAVFHDDPHRVFIGNRLTRPSFLSRGAAQAYANGINNGSRKPEFYNEEGYDQ